MPWTEDRQLLKNKFVFEDLGEGEDGYWLGICPFCIINGSALQFVGGLGPITANNIRHSVDASASYNFNKDSWRCLDAYDLGNCNGTKKAGTFTALIARMDSEIPDWRKQ